MQDFTGNNNNDVLHDVTNSGRAVNWRLRRLLTMKLAQSYKRLHHKKYPNIVDCASFLEFRRYKDGSLRLSNANFCKTRLCPACNWRRSKKTFAQISRIMDEISEDYEFIFLTLTCKSVVGVDLSKRIDDLFSAYQKLYDLKRFKGSVRGWVRCFEVNYNWETGTYNPHFHCILAVDKDYFETKKYIHQDEWCLMWQSCMNVNYEPHVWITKFTDSEKGKGKEVAEVAKYTVKSSNILANLKEINDVSQDIKIKIKQYTDGITDEIVKTLDLALYNRKLLPKGGIFKVMHKKLNLDKKDVDDLIFIGADGTQYKNMDFDIEWYRWEIFRKNYVNIPLVTNDDNIEDEAEPEAKN